MDLLTAINTSGKRDIIVKSLVWNSVIATFQEEKGIDIASYLISIALKKDAIIIKTNKPVVNSQGNILSDIIKEKVSEKLEKIGVKYKEFQLRFV